MLRVIRILAPNPGPFTLEGTNTWIVGADPSLVIDPGPDVSAHVEMVASAAQPVAAILVTHGHPDHAPAAPALAEATGAPVLAMQPPAGQSAGDRKGAGNQPEEPGAAPGSRGPARSTVRHRSGAGRAGRS